MGYTAFKGGADAIAAAQRLIAALPVDTDERLLELRQVTHQLGAAVDTVMGEGGLYAPELAALALLQCEGDVFEASFMVRAYRSTLPRFAYALPITGEAMRVRRRISSAFKDIPGGQLLGRTRDYTQRLLDLGRLETRTALPAAPSAEALPSAALVVSATAAPTNGGGPEAP
ncbi:MAG: carbon-phosphorus lyase complex subunit PhnI, partial [Dehalococcoidia bacterium]|nr:carbon-phosphorus lyase complex subunit PhnI [Dehalococcoidia bacterium]